MTAGGPGFLALEPDPVLDRFVAEAKRLVRGIAGDQRYLGDPPHLTLFVGVFPDHGELVERLGTAARAWTAPALPVQGWHVFRDDPLTGGHTLVVRLDPEGMAPLRRLQAGALQVAAPLRDLAASRDRYAAGWAHLGPVRRASLDAHGFPFTGEDWHPHVSVASIAPSSWERVWARLADAAPAGQARFPRLVWYALDGDRPRRVAEVELP